MEQEISIDQVRSRSISGVLALLSRSFIIQIITLVATLVLTYYLEPSVYGIFYLVTSVVNFLSYFADVGLAAAIIQKKEVVTKEDLATTFTIQQLLVVTLVGSVFILSSQIKSFFNLDPQGERLLFAMAISFFLSSLKTIPSILLEREIKFAKLVIPQILETLVFNFVAVIAAVKGFGVDSFSFAVIARGVVGLVAVYILFPWKPRFGIYRQSLQSLLKFGLPYQLNTFLAVLKDDGMNLILGKVVGTLGLGYLGWASRWASLPLRVLMDNLTKVSFPAFSRLQDDKPRLAKAVQINLKYLCLASFPIFIGMGFLAKPLLEIIPKYQKWLPALIPLYIYLYNGAWASVSTSLTNLLNATGRIKTTFKLMLMWTALTWVFMPILSMKFGYLGTSYAVGIIATSSFVTVLLARRTVHFSLRDSFATPLIASLALILTLTPFLNHLQSIPMIIFASIVGSVIYTSVVLIREGTGLITKVVSTYKAHR